MVVGVEYGREDIGFKLIFKHDLTKGTKHWCVFLDDDIIGTLCCRHEDDKGLTLCVSAWNLSTLKGVLITTDLPSSVSIRRGYPAHSDLAHLRRKYLP